MRSVILTETALAELEVITEYLSVFGESTANSFISEFQYKIDLLQDGVVEFPASLHPKLAEAGYRVVLVKSYLVLYRLIEDGSVAISHVFHQSQDYASLINDIQQ